jgi:two-component system sensor histidine kinase MprB
VNVPTRLALAFALVAAVVAGAVGLLSYHSAEQQTFDEIDRSLQSAATALASGQSAVLSPSFVDLPGPGGPGGGSGGPRTTATGRPS